MKIVKIDDRVIVTAMKMAIKPGISKEQRRGGFEIVRKLLDNNRTYESLEILKLIRSK